MELTVYHKNLQNSYTIIDKLDTNYTHEAKTFEHKPDTQWMVKEIPELEMSDREKELLKGTLNPTDLLELEKKEREEEETKTEEVKQAEYKKAYIQMVKLLALYKLNYHPFTNPSNLTKLEKDKIQSKMAKILWNYSKSELEEEVKLIIDNILADPKTDYSKLPVNTQ